MTTTDGSAALRSATAPPPPQAHPTPVARRSEPADTGTNRQRKPAGWLGPLASLRLTVVLMLLSVGLIFFGTLAQTRAGIWQVMAEYFRSWYVAVPLDLIVPADMELPGVLPWPGGATLGVLLLANLLAAHSVRFKLAATGGKLALGGLVTLLGIAAILVAFLYPPVTNVLATHGVVLLFALGSLFFVPLMLGAWLMFGRRFGVVLIHASLILLLVGEFVTAWVAEEAQMPIYTGQSLNWVQDIREAELAVMRPVLDNAGNETDERAVTAIRQAALADAADAGTLFDLAGTGLQLRVDRFMPNAGLVSRGNAPNAPAQATVGWGLDRVFAQPLPPVSGVGEQRVDQAAAVVSILDAGGQLVERVLVAVGMELRVAPYRPVVQRVDTPAGPIELVLRFKRTYLPYAVQLDEFRHDLYPGSDVPKNFSSAVTLVNDAGETERDALIRMNEPLRFGGKTFFQSGWIPGPDNLPGTDRGSVLQVVDNPGWTVPYIAVIVGGLGLTAHFLMALVGYLQRERVSTTRKASPGSIDTNPNRPRWPIAAATFGALAVSAAVLWPTAPKHADHGAFDLDSFGIAVVSYGGRFKPWDALARDTLVTINGRERVERDGQSIAPTQWLLDAITQRGGETDRVFRVDHPDLKHLIGVADFDRKRFSYTEIAPHLQEISRQSQAASATPSGQRTAFERAVLDLGNHVALFQGLVTLTDPHAVALTDANPETGEGWVSLPEAVTAGTLPGDAALVGNAIKAYGEGDAATFNDSVAAWRQSQIDRFPSLARKAEVESAFHVFKPFLRAEMLYVLAGLCVFVSWLVAPRALLLASLMLLTVALVVHTLGLGIRVYLSGRPPVTNLYGSAVFVGWGVVLLGIVMERITKFGLGYLTAAVTGFCTLLVARGLDDGDTMTVLQAVLDTNFWLATHVIVITLGYSAMFVAALVGAAYLALGAYTRALKKAKDRRAIEAAMFGVTCFALLLSFVGTILGGIWADQSWGRFWGWDPKENGALMIVLWAAVVIHARLGGMVKGPGIAGLSVLGAVVTLWSWFGVNMLGVGLHSYGFMDSALFWMLVAVAVLCAIASIALIPQRRWASLSG